MKRITLLAVSLFLLPALAPSLHADSIIDVPPSAVTFSITNTAAELQTGQIFTTGADTFLHSFEFYGYKSDLTSTFQIAPWTGTGPGTSLFSQSATGTTTAQSLIINTNSLQLNANSQYIAYIDCPINVPTSFNLSASNYTGGSAAILDPTNGWEAPYFSVNSIDDYAFTATFTTAATSVPLPPAALTGTVLLSLLAAAKLLRKKLQPVA